MGLTPSADRAFFAFPCRARAQRRLLVVENKPEIADVLRVKLCDEGFEVIHEHNGNAGLSLIENGVYDLIVLDCVFPGFDGFDFCRRLRARSEYTRLIIVSQEADKAQRIRGLDLGADDCLTKPICILELVARIRALLRRIDNNKNIHVERLLLIMAGELSIDVEARDVRVSGRPVSLTRREFDLLLFFARHPGKVFTRPELLDHVWGYGHDGYEHTVNSHINRLRSKIQAGSGSPSPITTIWGVGYKFEDQLARQALLDEAARFSL